MFNYTIFITHPIPTKFRNSQFIMIYTVQAMIGIHKFVLKTVTIRKLLWLCYSLWRYDRHIQRKDKQLKASRVVQLN